MSGKIKHMERSHKTRNNNYSAFSSFQRKAVVKKDIKEKQSFLDILKSKMHKNQSK